MKAVRMLFLALLVGLLFLAIGGADTAHSATATATLSVGWNQVCYVGAEQPVEAALGDIAGSVQALYKIGAGGALQRWFPGRPQMSTLDTLRPYDPILVLTSGTVTWTQTSDQVAPDAADLEQGWNAVCYEGGDEDIVEAVHGVHGQIAIIYALVPGQGWLRYVPDRPEINTLDSLQRHQPILVLISEPAGATWYFGGEEIALPPLAPFAASLQAKVHQIRDTMSSIRGLPLHSGMEEGTISRAALTQYYQQLAEQTRREQGEEFQAWNAAYRLLHLIGPQDDLLDISTAFSSSILGFYRPSDDKLVLVAEEIATVHTEDESTLAHEYVHTFQDARFDMEKLNQLAESEKETRSNTEYGATVECLIEGDAVVSEFRYMEAVYGPDWYEQVQPSDGETGGPDVPPGMVRYFYFPYGQCAAFVAQLFSQGGWDAVNRAYEDVPTSTEQILHPQKYASREGPSALQLPDMSAQLGQGWQQLDDFVFGEFDAYNYLLSSLENESGWDSVAKEAAAGWGGGRLATYAYDDAARVVLHLSLQWDSPNDLSQFVAAFLQVAGTTAGRWWPGDPGINTVRWASASEHGFATWQGNSFVALLSSNADDLRAATVATGHNLDAAVSPSLPAPPGKTDEAWLQQLASRYASIGGVAITWQSSDIWEMEGVHFLQLSLTLESAIVWLSASDQAKNNWGHAVLDEAMNRSPGADVAVLVTDPGYFTWDPSFGSDWCYVGSYYPGSGWYQQCTLLRAYWFESLQDSWVEFFVISLLPVAGQARSVSLVRDPGRASPSP